MTAEFTTERIFSLSTFEGVRLVRSYVAKQPDIPMPELLGIIVNLEPDGVSLDLEAAAYLHQLVEKDCPTQGDGFYQACIFAVVTQHQPLWAKAMRQGRMRFLGSLGKNDRDVFAAAGLEKNPPPIELVKWWDGVCTHARLIGDVQKLEQGREAELLTIDYEITRLAELGINEPPVWKGLDDNFAGYDVLSYDLGEFGQVNRLIEVKSTSVTPLKFSVTRNEWDQAKKSGPAYIFHIWDMAKTPPQLHVRTLDQVKPHIPTDNEKGRWANAEIPVGGA